MCRAAFRSVFYIRKATLGWNRLSPNTFLFVHKNLGLERAQFGYTLTKANYLLTKFQEIFRNIFMHPHVILSANLGLKICLCFSIFPCTGAYPAKLKSIHIETPDHGDVSALIFCAQSFCFHSMRRRMRGLCTHMASRGVSFRVQSTSLPVWALHPLKNLPLSQMYFHFY